MTDLVDMFEDEGPKSTNDIEDNNFNSLDFASAIGLAETFLEEEDQVLDNTESLFDNSDPEKMHEEAERVSLKEKNNNIPTFERYVMKKCGLL